MKMSKVLLHSICGVFLAASYGCDNGPSGTGTGSADGGSDTEPEDEDDGSNLTSGNSASMSGQDSMTTAPPTTGMSATSGPDPTGDTGDDNGFISPPDGGIEGQCDPAAQDCPEGQKCTGVVTTPGGETVDANHCVEIMGDLQFGEACTRIEGNDDCAPGFFCMSEVSGNTGEGICLEYCEVMQPCEFGGECFAFNDGQLPLCQQLCDPLAPACTAGQGCYPAFDRYVCAIPGAMAGMGADGDSCAVIQGCNPGLFCSGAAEGCTNESGCCTDFCDLSEADLCMGTEMCTALAEMPMPGFEDVGGCVVPE